MLNLYQSNTLEALAALWQAVRQPPQDPLCPETVLVPSKGVQRWLALWLARETGIAANLDFQLPAALVWRLIQQALPQVVARSNFDPDVLVWRALSQLSAVLERHPAASLAGSWLAADAAGRYQLAWRVADVFDQYLIYRPDWVQTWEAGRLSGLGEDERWQAELWQRLAKGSRHRGHLLSILEQKLRAGAMDGLPQRLCLFGIGMLPPSYWELMQVLGTRIDIDCFLLNPSREYWGQACRGEEGSHPLLAALGQQGRDFINTVAAGGVNEPVEAQAFIEFGHHTLLHTLQTDLLDQQQRAPAERLLLRPDDDSISIQSCHSALREVEVLHDKLTAMFEADATLAPHEVLVMVSDIQRYAPLVDAVFGTRRQPAIPYTIADRRLELEEPLLARFFDLLALPGSRFELPRVLGLLEEPALCARFGLETADITLIMRWCEELQLRWGRDAADRRGRGLPDDMPITWRAGLDRLLLGFVLPPQLAPRDDTRHLGIAPAGLVGSVSQAQVMVRFVQLVNTLLRWEKRLQQPANLLQWCETLEQLLHDFFAETEASGGALQHLREVMAELREQARLADDTALHPFPVMQAWLKRQVQGLESRRGFLHGAVTVCAMVPMRSLPFRVIAVLGLDDGVFPRHQRPWHFDLMAVHPRAGDRSRRLDDRYLFLEILMAARERLYLSFIGRSDTDDSLRAPSPVLLELLDQIRETVVCADGAQDVAQRLTTEHALQPFNARYFSGDAEYPSYVQRFYEAAAILARGKKSAAPVAVPALLPEPEAEWLSLTLDKLGRFLGNPARFLLRDRLGIRLEAEADILPDQEPVNMAHVQRDLRERLLLAEADTGSAILRAEGLLLAGSWGDYLLQNETDIVDSLREPVAAALRERLPPEAFRIELDAMVLEGLLNGLTPDGLVRWSLNNRIYDSDVLSLWLHHLLLCKLAPSGVVLQSRLLGVDREVLLMPVANPDAHLRQLLAAWREGLRRPLPLFRRASPVFVKSEGDIDKAYFAYIGGEYAGGDADDPWVALAWRDADPFTSDFAHWAEVVFGPIAEHLS
jgi:exodeoxyribonuclease V gamma subunit